MTPAPPQLTEFCLLTEKSDVCAHNPAARHKRQCCLGRTFCLHCSQQGLQVAPELGPDPLIAPFPLWNGQWWHEMTRTNLTVLLLSAGINWLKGELKQRSTWTLLIQWEEWNNSNKKIILITQLDCWSHLGCQTTPIPTCSQPHNSTASFTCVVKPHPFSPVPYHPYPPVPNHPFPPVLSHPFPPIHNHQFPPVPNHQFPPIPNHPFPPVPNHPFPPVLHHPFPPDPNHLFPPVPNHPFPPVPNHTVQLLVSPV